MKYRCLICGHIYDEEKEGVKFADFLQIGNVQLVNNQKEKICSSRRRNVLGC